MSTWTTVASGANVRTSPVSRSSKRVPIATRQSQWEIAMFAYPVPCIPAHDRARSWSSGNVPMPGIVVVTGISYVRANARSSALASATASGSASPGGSAVAGVSGSAGAQVVSPVVTSFGRSTSVGPCRPVPAMANASPTASPTASGSVAKWFAFVIGAVTPVVSVSWKASLPTRSVETCPVSATRGSESMSASAMPVTRFVAPGPEVARQTPGSPVTWP
jgi:hypothetical protein